MAAQSVLKRKYSRNLAFDCAWGSMRLIFALTLACRSRRSEMTTCACSHRPTSIQAPHEASYCCFRLFNSPKKSYAHSTDICCFNCFMALMAAAAVDSTSLHKCLECHADMHARCLLCLKHTKMMRCSYGMAVIQRKGDVAHQPPISCQHVAGAAGAATLPRAHVTACC